jgi:hypothetical protein
MKMKSFAMLAMSGLLATSFGYVAKAMAEGDASSNNGQSMQTVPSDNNMQNPGSSSQNNSGSSSDMNNNSNNNGSSSSGTDEGSPDTATGDDDY